MPHGLVAEKSIIDLINNEGSRFSGTLALVDDHFNGYTRYVNSLHDNTKVTPRNFMLNEEHQQLRSGIQSCRKDIYFRNNLSAAGAYFKRSDKDYQQYGLPPYRSQKEQSVIGKLFDSHTRHLNDDYNNVYYALEIIKTVQLKLCHYITKYLSGDKATREIIDSTHLIVFVRLLKILIIFDVDLDSTTKDLFQQTIHYLRTTTPAQARSPYLTNFYGPLFIVAAPAQREHHHLIPAPYQGTSVCSSAVPPGLPNIVDDGGQSVSSVKKFK